MLISLKAVYLGGKEVSVKRSGKPEQRLLGRFHQPRAEDNTLISVLLPTESKLDPYKEYQITGNLNTWAFNNQVMSRVEAMDCKLLDK